MKSFSLRHKQSKWAQGSSSMAAQWEEMGRAIGEIRKERSRWRDYLEETKSEKPWWRRWLTLG